MPSVSKSQQRLFGAALAYKRGETDSVSDEVKNLADSMSEEKLSEFASTKHEGLPKTAYQFGYYSGYLNK